MYSAEEADSKEINKMIIEKKKKKTDKILTYKHVIFFI